MRTASPIKRLVEETAKLQEELIGKRVLLRLMLSEKLIGDEKTKEAAEELLGRALPTEQRMDPGGRAGNPNEQGNQGAGGLMGGGKGAIRSEASAGQLQ
jgi:hypothetical protein